MKVMPKTRVSLNYKAYQLGWLKAKKKNFLNSFRLTSTNNSNNQKNLATKFYN